MLTTEAQRKFKEVSTKEVNYVMQGNRYYAVEETGEINYNLDVRPVISRDQADGYKKKMEAQESEMYLAFSTTQKDESTESHYIFMIYTPLRVFLSEYPSLSKGDYARLVYLSTYMQFNGTRLKMNARKFAKKSDIKTMLGISRQTAHLFLERTIEAGILTIDENKHVHMSQNVFKHGAVGRTGEGRMFARVYIQNTRQLYEMFKVGKRIEKLSILYALIPYIDLRFNIICKNANEDIRDVAEIDPLSLEEIADILGVSDTHHLKTTIDSIKVEIEGLTYHLMEYNEIGEYIAVSPFFIYRGTNADWMKKATHLSFYLELVKQLRNKGLCGSDRVEEIERRIAEL